MSGAAFVDPRASPFMSSSALMTSGGRMRRVNDSRACRTTYSAYAICSRLMPTRMIAASSVANRALVVDTRLWWVLCHVLSVSWASTRRLALHCAHHVWLDEPTMTATHRHLASNAVLVSTQTLDRRAACLARLDMLTWTLMRRLSVQHVRVVTMPQWA